MTSPLNSTSAAADSSEAAGSQVISLAPIPQPPEEDPGRDLGRELRRMDLALAGLVVLLSFLATSFAIRNSDIWMHLAAGRLLAQGGYTFGQDPFAYTTAGVYWANHAWLFDWISYGLVRLAGGPEAPLAGVLLVGSKALACSLLAFVLLHVRRRSESLWIPAVCTALAMLSASSRALYQSTAFSFLFLGVTLWLLTRPTKARWGLPVVFALWVNVDSWFILGPITVALYLLGELIQAQLAPVRTGEDAPMPGETKSLGLIFVVSFAACLLNPHHVHAFVLPVDLSSPTLDIIHEQDDRIFVFPSAFSSEYYSRPERGLNVSGFAYFPLLVLGLASFALNFKDWRGWRVAVWLFFAIVSAWQARAIPFFAVVGGPILALNLQDFAVRRFGSEMKRWTAGRAWPILGRLLSIVLVCGLIFASWPGWLHARPDDPVMNRRVSWALEADASLVQAGRQLADWRSRGILPATARGFNFTPDIASYMAWNCPEEKGFFDFRFQLFADVAAAYVEIRHALRGVSGKSAASFGALPGAGLAVMQRTFQEQGVTHLLLYSNEFDSHMVRFRLLDDSSQWTPVYLDGRTSIFAWKDRLARNQEKSALVKEALDLRALAFGAGLEERGRAPEAGPGRSSRTPETWERIVRGPGSRQLDAEAAGLYLALFEILSSRWTNYYVSAMNVGHWTGAVTASGSGAGLVAAEGAAAFLNRFPLEPILNDKGKGPVAPLFLALRAARRALAANPDSGQVQLLLAKAYVTLWQSLENRWLSENLRVSLQSRQALREVQTLAALRAGLAIRPEDEDAQFLASNLLFQLGYRDAALEHHREAIRLTKENGPKLGETAEQFGNRRKEFEESLKQIENDVKSQTNQYEVSAANQRLGAKVQIALQLGLGKKALELLMEADPSQISPREADLQLSLLAFLGRTDDLRERLTPEIRQALPGMNYEWYHTLLAAATGDYKEAGKYLDEMILSLDQGTANYGLAWTTSQTFQGQLGPQGLFEMHKVVAGLRQVADFRVMRGLLALEEGDLLTAKKAFQAALDTGRPAAGASRDEDSPFFFESRELAVRYLREIDHAQR